VISRILLFLLAVGLLGGLLAWSQWSRQPLHVSGYIEADEIRIGSRVGGRVKSVSAQEGTGVQKGQVLVELEPFDLLERRAQAAAQLAAAQADFALLSAGYREEEVLQAKARYDQLTAHLAKLKQGPRAQEIAAAEARLKASQSELRRSQSNYERTSKLFSSGTKTREEMDFANEQRDVASAMVEVRDQELAELKEGTRAEDILEAEAQLEEAAQAWKLRANGFRTEEVAKAKATMHAAAAALEAIDQQIAELKIVSPVDGVVEAVELQPGDLVSAGAPVLSLMDTTHLWMRAYVPETRLNLQTGQKVEVALDSFPKRRFAGEVTFISRQAEFTPANVQTPEERSKQVFRIKVRLLEGLDQLRPGMSGDVYLESDAEVP
jgi:multidrug resistance efflux pump